ncbi:hypothetical protein ACHHRT_11230 [Desulfurivibrio sp. D14AmB]|uniref:hypothetical protein n=1 Tax=Desulfurivibrio sp. D14AmB TaxID=3374370 RepID=UPI00376EA5DE
MIRVVVLLLLLLAALLAGFVILNWAAFLTVFPLSLGVTEVDGPLGLIMLLLAALLAGPSLVYAIYVRQSSLLRAGRTAEEMQELRKLAERAETSRYTALREFMAAETQKLSEQNHQLRAELRADLEKLAARLEAPAGAPAPADEEEVLDLDLNERESN